MAGDSILVSWKPPTQPNGLVIQYTVYVREDSEEAKDVSCIQIKYSTKTKVILRKFITFLMFLDILSILEHI